MTINIEGTGTSIDLTIFRSCSLNDRMRMVTFTYQPQGGDSDVTFPLLFSSRTEARRFWNGYRKAQERKWQVYHVRGIEVSFCMEFYDRILRDAYMTENRETCFRVPRKRIS
jgi:hypothetical protein